MEMPVAPDTSYQAYQQAMYNKYGMPYLQWLTNFHSAHPGDFQTYESWKAQSENQYNVDKDAYNQWYNTYAHQRELLELAGYNANYAGMSGSAGSQGSPSSYMGVQDAPAAVEPFGELQKILSIAGQGLGMTNQTVGTVMNVLQTMNSLDLSGMDKENKRLANQVTNLGLVKLINQLFDPQDFETAWDWLMGAPNDVDAIKERRNLEATGSETKLSMLLKRGPMWRDSEIRRRVQESVRNLNLTKEDLEKLKADFQQGQNDMQDWNQGLGVAGKIFNMLLGGIGLFL